MELSGITKTKTHNIRHFKDFIQRFEITLRHWWKNCDAIYVGSVKCQKEI